MSGRRQPWLLVVGALLVLAGGVMLAVSLAHRSQEPRSASRRVSLRDFDEVVVRVTDRNGRTRRWRLLAARTEREHEQGLMRVRDRTLGGHDGMVFLFDEDQRTGFWMRNTPMPLSIAYFDRRGRVVSITQMAACGDSPGCRVYPPSGPYRSAIEVPRRGLERLGIDQASRLKVGGGCGDGAAR